MNLLFEMKGGSVNFTVNIMFKLGMFYFFIYLGKGRVDEITSRPLLQLCYCKFEKSSLQITKSKKIMLCCIYSFSLFL
jgi:hypothetical protein